MRWLRPWGGCGGSSGAHSLAPGWVPTAFTGSLGSCAQAWDSRGPYTPPPPGAEEGSSDLQDLHVGLSDLESAFLHFTFLLRMMRIPSTNMIVARVIPTVCTVA